MVRLLRLSDFLQFPNLIVLKKSKQFKNLSSLKNEYHFINHKKRIYY